MVPVRKYALNLDIMPVVPAANECPARILCCIAALFRRWGAVESAEFSAYVKIVTPGQWWSAELCQLRGGTAATKDL